MREDDFEKQGERLVILFEGRDAAGKTSSIRETFSRLAQTHASVRIMKPARPSDEERAGFWFDRFGAALDATKDANVVLFDRSWYVRPTVERVMGYCSPLELDHFFASVHRVERDLARSGVRLLKLFLAIDDREQERRLDARRERSAIDASALAHSKDYARAEADIFTRTPPWVVIPANDWHAAQRAIWERVSTTLLGRPP